MNNVCTHTVWVVEDSSIRREAWRALVELRAGRGAVLPMSGWEELAAATPTPRRILTSPRMLLKAVETEDASLCARLSKVCLICMGPELNCVPPPGWRVTHLEENTGLDHFYTALGLGDLSLSHTRLESLSARESLVAHSLSQGHSHKELAGHLGVSLSSVQSYQRRAMRKLGVDSLADLCVHAAALGLRPCPCRKTDFS